MKKVLVIAVAILMVFAMAACGGGGGGGDTAATPEPAPVADTAAPAVSDAAGQKVGISMPTKSLQRWNQDGSYMEQMFKDAGFEVDLQYGGENEVPVQINQIENMIAGGCSVLVIAAIDGDSMTEVLADAKSKGIVVIAYDRLIMGTDAISYYATFDNWKVGTFQGTYVKDNLDLDNADGPFNIEFFTGDPGDNNINFFFGGAMEVLEPFLQAGKLVCPSGQTEKITVATEGWKTENAQARMENLITSNNYGPTKTKLDAVMCSNDSTAQGVTNALVNAGYTADNFPIVTGQDCDVVSCKNMLAGTQSMSVFKDTRTLAAQVVKMVSQFFNGETVDVNDTTTYDNGTGVIPSFLCEPVSYTVNDMQKLVDSGYYSADEIGL